MRIRRPNFIQISAVVLVIMLSIGLDYVYRLVVTGVSYKAKVLCSDIFISHRSVDSILNEDLAAEDLAAMRFIRSDVNWANQQVLASFLGIIGQKAVYRPESGCSLVFADKGISALAEAQLLSTPVNDSKEPRSFAPKDLAQASTDDPPIRDSRLDSALNWAFAEPDPQYQRRTRAVVIMQDGKIIAERYAAGFGPNMPVAGWSLAKSVMNALVGILVGQRQLDLAAPAALPEWQGAGDRRRSITLDQLMHMVSGLEFSEEAGKPLGDVTQMLLRVPDAGAYAASKSLAFPPGTSWHYASGTTNIISRILRATLGEAKYRRFPREALFEPLGMSSAVLEADASGTFVGSSFLYATARDWAKLGQLYLQDGVWEGRRLLPEGWVAYSSRPSPVEPRYGAHFWLDIQQEYAASDPEKPLPKDAFHAMGYEGQCVSIVPSRGLVVVRLGLTRNSSAWRQDRFVNKILAALGG